MVTLSPLLFFPPILQGGKKSNGGSEGLGVHGYIAITGCSYMACDHHVCLRSKGRYHLHHSYLLVRGKPRFLSEGSALSLGV